MGPLLWRITDHTGYHSTLTLLRNAHRTAVTVFPDGPKHRTDPSKTDAFDQTHD
jgi:hypothetical protein